MDAYQTEEEQYAAVKKWFMQNGQWIVFGVSFFGIVYFGKQYFDQQDIKTNQAAYVLHSEVNQARTQYLEAADDKKSLAKDALLLKLDTLKESHESHPLTELAVLSSASAFVENQNFDIAESELQWILNSDPEKEIEDLVRLRLGQVLFQKDQLDKALEVVQASIGANKGYQDSLLELQGDIYLAQALPKKALKSYKASMKANDVISSHQALQWKIDDLTGVQSK